MKIKLSEVKINYDFDEVYSKLKQLQNKDISLTLDYLKTLKNEAISINIKEGKRILNEGAVSDLIDTVYRTTMDHVNNYHLDREKYNKFDLEAWQKKIPEMFKQAYAQDARAFDLEYADDLRDIEKQATRKKSKWW